MSLSRFISYRPFGFIIQLGGISPVGGILEVQDKCHHRALSQHLTSPPSTLATNPLLLLIPSGTVERLAFRASTYRRWTRSCAHRSFLFYQIFWSFLFRVAIFLVTASRATEILSSKRPQQSKIHLALILYTTA